MPVIDGRVEAAKHRAKILSDAYDMLGLEVNLLLWAGRTQWYVRGTLVEVLNNYYGVSSVHLSYQRGPGSPTMGAWDLGQVASIEEAWSAPRAANP